jgi:hypothetical protein
LLLVELAAGLKLLNLPLDSGFTTGIAVNYPPRQSTHHRPLLTVLVESDVTGPMNIFNPADISQVHRFVVQSVQVPILVNQDRRYGFHR